MVFYSQGQLPGRLPGERGAVGDDGVPAGGQPHRRRHRDLHGRGPDRGRLPRSPPGPRLPPQGRRGIQTDCYYEQSNI